MLGAMLGDAVGDIDGVSVGDELVGELVVGDDVEGLAVIGLDVVGDEVVGLNVVGDKVVGDLEGAAVGWLVVGNQVIPVSQSTIVTPAA